MSPATLTSFDLLIRVSLLLGAGMVTAIALHRRSASVRHLLLAASLGGSLVLAVLVPWAPRLEIPVKAWRSDAPRSARSLRVLRGSRALPKLVQRDAPTAPLVAGTPGIAADEGVVSDSAMTSNLTIVRASAPQPLWLMVWVAGALLTLGWGLSGRLGLVLLARRARRITDGPWRTMVDETALRLGVTKPIAILMSDRVGAPMTWGSRRPVLMVPVESESWSDDLRGSVAAHEVAHIARNDYLLQLMAVTSCAVYWFHPFIWMTTHRMRQAAERACDDQVLRLGTAGEEYAAHLIGVARVSRDLRLSGAVAIGMARPSTLEGRIVDVLDPSRSRGDAGGRVRRIVAAAAVVTLVFVGAVRPVPAATTEYRTIEFNPIEPSVESNVVTGHAAAVAPEPVINTNFVQGRDSSFERSFDVSRGGTLTLDLNTGGGVTVRGWDEDRVVVKARLAGTDWRDVEVDVSRQSDGVRLTTDYLRRRGNFSTSNEFEIRVPRRYDVRISSSGGGLTLIDLEGRFTGHTGGGEFVIERVKGSASLTTGGGEIHVSDSDLSGRVSTGGGTVLLSRVSGGLRGSSGSGPVVYGESGSRGGERRSTTDLSSVEVTSGGSRISIGKNTDYRAGTLSIDKAGGDIDLEAAPNGARVHTGGGRVSVGRADGDVDASTGGGDVSVGPAAGSVRATTGAGEVRIVVDRLRSTDQVIEAWSGKGRIIIELPSDFAGRLDLETAHTRTHEETARIRSDWELEREPLTDWSTRQGTARRYLRASAIIGRGGNARVIVRTMNGEIEIRRR